MPTVTYMGRSWSTRNIDGNYPDFKKGVPLEVTTAWLDKWGHRLSDDFIIEGYESVDEGNDDIPDAGWKRGDIVEWLAKYDIKPKGYATKTTLLELVETVMSPDGVQETEALIEESAEEETTGDE